MSARKHPTGQRTTPPCCPRGRCVKNPAFPALPRLDIASIFGGTRSARSPIHLFIKDGRRRWIFLNETARRLLKLPKDAILGTVGKGLIPKPLAELFCGSDKSVLETGKPCSATRMVFWKGSPRFFRQTVRLHRAGGRRFIVGCVRDITAEVNAAKELQIRNTVLSVVSKAAQALILAPPEKFNRAVNRSLRQLAGATDVSRACIFEVCRHRGGKAACIRFEWVAKGIPPGIDNPKLQKMVMDGVHFTNIFAALADGVTYQGHGADFTPAERRFLPFLRVQSFISVPILLHGRFWGFVVLEEWRRRRVWSSAEANALRIAAGLLGAAIEREQNRRALLEAARNALRTQKEIRLLRRHAETVREEEQKKIALRLHDDFGQRLTMLISDLAWLRDEPNPPPAEIHGRVEEGIRRISDLLTLVKDISMDLRPAVLDHFGLGASMEWLAERFNKSTGIKTVTTITEGAALPKEQEYALFRVLKELLTNVAKHSRATRLHVSLAPGKGWMVLTVSDNGVGWKAARCSADGGLGLIGVRERIAAFDGKLETKAGKGGGATVSVKLPMPPKKHDKPRQGKDVRP